MDLIHKTNQFNLTTRRYSATELKKMIWHPQHAGFYLRLSDRFGDNGIVGVGIVLLRNSTAHVDTLLLSCRVIGRSAETALLSVLVDWAKARGATTIEGEFVATPRNAPAADFYPRHGFAQVAGNGSGVTRWQLSTAEVPFHWPSYIGITAGAGETR